jgi:hypothetical protein
MDAPECAPIDAVASGRPSPSASFNRARSFTSAAISATGDADILTKPQMARSNIQAGRSRPRSPSSSPIKQRKMSPLARSLASRTRTRRPDQG